MTLAKHSVRFFSASAIGCAFLLAGSQMGCEPADEGVSPRDTTTPRSTTPTTPRDTTTTPPNNTPPTDPYDDPMNDPNEPGTQPGGTQP